MPVLACRPSRVWPSFVKSMPPCWFECWLATGPLRIMSQALPEVLGIPVMVSPVVLTRIFAFPASPSGTKTPSTKSKVQAENLLVFTLPRLPKFRVCTTALRGSSALR